MVKKIRKTKGLVIKKVKLDNKSRKGNYVYIRKDGKRGSYYKLQKGMSLKDNLNDYLMAYDGKVRSKKSGISKDKPAKLYKKVLRDTPLIETLIKKGIWTTHLKNASNMTPLQVKASYKELLKRAVLSNDDETLDLLIQDSNIQKLKHRFEFRISILDKEDNVLVRLNHVGKKDIEEVLSDMKSVFVDKNITGKSPDFTQTESNKKGYMYSHVSQGKAVNFQVSVLMRKAK